MRKAVVLVAMIGLALTVAHAGPGQDLETALQLFAARVHGGPASEDERAELELVVAQLRSRGYPDEAIFRAAHRLASDTDHESWLFLMTIIEEVYEGAEEPAAKGPVPVGFDDFWAVGEGLDRYPTANWVIQYHRLVLGRNPTTQELLESMRILGKHVTESDAHPSTVHGVIAGCIAAGQRATFVEAFEHAWAKRQAPFPDLIIDHRRPSASKVLQWGPLPPPVGKDVDRLSVRSSRSFEQTWSTVGTGDDQSIATIIAWLEQRTPWNDHPDRAALGLSLLIDARRGEVLQFLPPALAHGMMGNPQLAAVAASAVIRLEAPELTPLVIRAIGAEQTDIRVAVIESVLGALGSRTSWVGRVHPSAYHAYLEIKDLEVALNELWPHQKRPSGRILVRLRVDETWEPLDQIPWVVTHQGEDALDTQALAQLPSVLIDEQLVERLLRIGQDPDPQARAAAVRYGLSASTTIFGPLLLSAFSDENAIVWEAAASALERTPRVPILSALEGMAAHRDPKVRLRVVEALARCPDPKAADTLAFFVRDDDASVRNRARAALRERGLQ